MSFSEWKEVKLGDIAQYSTSRINTESLTRDNYISTENMLPQKGGATIASTLPNGNVVKYRCGQTLISNIRPYFKKIWYAIKDGGCSSDVLVFDILSNIESKYFYYLLSQDNFFDYMMAGSKGTKMPRGDKKQIMMYPILLPPPCEQESIADTLSCLDDKIELNNRINKTLEEMAQAIFKSWFVDFEPFQDGEFEDCELGKIPKGWNVGSLDTIANYLNGLAMQKFRPEGEEYLPVIKIKELNQGTTDENSDKASVDIKKEYIIHDGDVIFSWSGTLLVKIWTGGMGGLNQHLFKVTSDKFPKWYYYLWTCHHLRQFQAIAKDKATTMGHIKRSHLSESKVLIPNEKDFNTLNEIMTPLINQIIEVSCQNIKFIQIRDTLLPKLMSGEIRVPTEEV